MSCLAAVVTVTLCSSIGIAQTGASDIYNAIKARPSSTPWCHAAAGDDPAHIISGRCKIYAECLNTADLDAKVDQIPFPELTAEKVERLRKCHQYLFNAARANPQIKGSAATQKWLLKSVSPGSEAKSFPVPASMGDPR